MPYCPKCRCEFIEGIKTCNDCGVELVDELPPDEQEQGDDENQVEWEKVLNVRTDSEAEMYIELLKSEDIPAFKKSYNIPFYIDNAYGVDILVPKELKDKAAEIIPTLNTEENISVEIEDTLIDESNSQDFNNQDEKVTNNKISILRVAGAALLLIIFLVLIDPTLLSGVFLVFHAIISLFKQIIF